MCLWTSEDVADSFFSHLDHLGPHEKIDIDKLGYFILGRTLKRCPMYKSVKELPWCWKHYIGKYLIVMAESKNNGVLYHHYEEEETLRQKLF